MIKFFRNIRRRLLRENRFTRYLLYAVGEIILVVIGILIALRINNANEIRKNEEKFNSLLEQIYTVLDQDRDWMRNNLSILESQQEIVFELLGDTTSLEMNLLPQMLYYLDLYPAEIQSEVDYYLQFLHFNPNNTEQSKLCKSISSYSNFGLTGLSRINQPMISPVLRRNGLPEPALDFGYSYINNFQNIDTSFYDLEERELVLDLLKEEEVKDALRAVRSRKSVAIVWLLNGIEEANSNMRHIRKYYPDVKLIYQDIGIVGSATENGNWEENVPLILTSSKKAIWEAKVKLQSGSLKFRDGNSWKFNWGGNTFPEGRADYFGDDIIVEEGTYKVVLDLTAKTYKFLLIDD